MTGTTTIFSLDHFSREQLQAIEMVLRILDSDEYRDYHDQFGNCNAPDMIEKLREEVKEALAS